MEVVADGRVAHVGTVNANPVCAAAALAAITWLECNQRVPIDDSMAMTRISRSIAAERVRTRVGIV
jgi:hypothetical protein